MGSTSPLHQSITIRPALPSDAPAIATLGGTVFSTTFGWSMPASDLQAYLTASYTTSAILKDIQDPNKTILVAVPSEENGGESGGGILGFVQLTEGTSEPCIEGMQGPIELQRLYVGLEHKGRGIGRIMTEAIEKIAREEKKAKTIWLGVWEENFSAQKVYEKLGFKKIGTHDFVMGECVQTDWILWKDL
ncbi:acyl-CoA N-acyltransferase [Tricladium varicosporioides]|nr:acyl-CoA N-acyltransferase [Hymenoscyphus varicosporioides]